MPARYSASPRKIFKVTVNRRQPPVGVADLALMLEIDLSFGRKNDFRRRLQRALNDAWRQGFEA